MTAAGLAGFAALVLATSMLAGVFGMAGGMILMGVLVVFLPVPIAMVLHGVTQMASTGWRAAMWRGHIEWTIVARYLVGLSAAAVLFASFRFVPDERLVFLFLGLPPFIVLLLPERIVPRVERVGFAEASGFVCGSLQFLSGVSGPLLDVFFVRSPMGRHQVVATKAACQVATHGFKLAYFGLLIGTDAGNHLWPEVILFAVAMAVLGTTLSRSVLERLSDEGFRRYTRWIVLGIGAVYVTRAVVGPP